MKPLYKIGDLVIYNAQSATVDKVITLRRNHKDPSTPLVWYLYDLSLGDEKFTDVPEELLQDTLCL